MNQNKYYAVKSIDLAKALVFITGQDYYKFEDKKNDGKKIHSFKDTDVLRSALTEIMTLKNIYKQ
ncbi:hypothetical protein [Psychrobacillus sp. L3]|uniref:hypothetical protein n=1 Tax=Psychrobacillus sp. L3 TaxID=3236891 RepID=UPI0036F39ED1